MRAPASSGGSPRALAGRDRRAEERSPELLCLVLLHSNWTSRAGIPLLSAFKVQGAASRHPRLHSSPVSARSRLRSLDDLEEAQLAPSYCPDGTPVGLGQDVVVDLWTRRRGWAASESQFVQEILKNRGGAQFAQATGRASWSAASC